MPDNNWKNILSTEKKYHFRIIHPAKTIFRSKGKIKDFRVKIKGKKICHQQSSTTKNPKGSSSGWRETILARKSPLDLLLIM